MDPYNDRDAATANLELRALDRQDTDGVIRDFSDSDSDIDDIDDDEDDDIEVKDDAQEGVLADNIEGEQQVPALRLDYTQLQKA